MKRNITFILKPSLMPSDDQFEGTLAYIAAVTNSEFAAANITSMATFIVLYGCDNPAAPIERFAEPGQVFENSPPEYKARSVDELRKFSRFAAAADPTAKPGVPDPEPPAPEPTTAEDAAILGAQAADAAGSAQKYAAAIMLSKRNAALFQALPELRQELAGMLDCPVVGMPHLIEGTRMLALVTPMSDKSRLMEIANALFDKHYAATKSNLLGRLAASRKAYNESRKAYHNLLNLVEHLDA